METKSLLTPKTETGFTSWQGCMLIYGRGCIFVFFGYTMILTTKFIFQKYWEISVKLEYPNTIGKNTGAIIIISLY